MSVLNIFEYADFRQFIKDYQLSRKAKDKSFTKSQFCKLLGLPNTRSYLTNVLRNKEVSREFIERFIQAMNLKNDEAQYFRILVQFNQCTNEKERDYLFDQLIAYNKTPKNILPPNAYGFYKEWYPSAIRSLLDVMDIDGDYDSLNNRLYPKIGIKKIKESMEILIRLELITKNEKGFWKPTDKTIKTSPYVDDELIKQYQLKCYELGKQILLDKTVEGKNFSTVNLSVSKGMLKKLESRLQQFKKEIHTMVNKDTDPADIVYHLNVQLFPQSRLPND